MSVTRLTKQQRFWTKEAETTGTPIMPNQPPSDKKVGKQKATVSKTAMAPYVDVSGCEVDDSSAKPSADRYALPGLERYPLDSYWEVKQAAAYFEEHWRAFGATHRREFANNLVKRASQIGVDVGELAGRYGSDEYSCDVDAMLEGRRNLMTSEEREPFIPVLDKLAEARPLLPPDVFCEALRELDEASGLSSAWDRFIPDPYLSTYGSKTAAPKDELILVDNVSASKSDIMKAAKTHMKSISSTFGDDFASEFRKDPMGIFSSLPRDQKKMIMRMVTDNAPNPDLTGSV